MSVVEVVEPQERPEIFYVDTMIPVDNISRLTTIVSENSDESVSQLIHHFKGPECSVPYDNHNIVTYKRHDTGSSVSVQGPLAQFVKCWGDQPLQNRSWWRVRVRSNHSHSGHSFIDSSKPFFHIGIASFAHKSKRVGFGIEFKQQNSAEFLCALDHDRILIVQGRSHGSHAYNVILDTRLPEQIEGPFVPYLKLQPNVINGELTVPTMMTMDVVESNDQLDELIRVIR